LEAFMDLGPAWVWAALYFLTLVAYLVSTWLWLKAEDAKDLAFRLWQESEAALARMITMNRALTEMLTKRTKE